VSGFNSLVSLQIRIRVKRPFSARLHLTPHLVAPILRLTGFRFDKSWRNSRRGVKAFVYRRLLFTPTANVLADGGR
jgi:hypothetical protein